MIQGFLTRMVYLYSDIESRYTILVGNPQYINTFHTALQMRIYHFHHDVISTRKRETLVLDQYFHFGVPSVGVTAPS